MVPLSTEALEILGSTLAEAFKCLGGFLYSKISTIFKYQTNINSLINQRSRLADLKKSIKDQLELANKEGKVPTPEVERWLQDVEKIEEDLKFMDSEITANDARLHRPCELTRQLDPRELCGELDPRPTLRSANNPLRTSSGSTIYNRMLLCL
ncbi:hypothetical protein QJS04_geneDACA019083 [Acorus gramineus]|uniref:Uncharacterized protein n=1 Tax=Acorus gramineus TaxID=55184 RepID=A0AAV9AB95_ACOGR|nr:hypothetical protein QJS04_geneDACA019083 [Acorus gramineus]